MRRGMNWYKRDPIAFLDGVQGMGPEAIGAYAVLLDLIYARGGETKRDDRHLAGLLGCSARKARALTDALIEAGKLSVEGDFVVNSRAKSEAKCARNTHETRVNAGRKGGERSAISRKNKGLAEASASSKNEPDKRREENTPHNPPEGGSACGVDEPKDLLGEVSPEQSKPRFSEETFETWWQAFPAQRRGAKPKCREKFRAIIKSGVSAEELIDGARRYARSDNVRRGYAMSPHRWLNEGRWTDEVSSATGGGGGSGSGSGGRGGGGETRAQAIIRRREQERRQRSSDASAPVSGSMHSEAFVGSG